MKLATVYDARFFTLSKRSTFLMACLSSRPLARDFSAHYAKTSEVISIHLRNGIVRLNKES